MTHVTRRNIAPSGAIGQNEEEKEKEKEEEAEEMAGEGKEPEREWEAPDCREAKVSDGQRPNVTEYHCVSTRVLRGPSTVIVFFAHRGPVAFRMAKNFATSS